MVAFKICQDINCPHPSQLESFGIGIDELNDWFGFYLWDADPDDGPDDSEKISFLEQFMAEEQKYAKSLPGA